jgi:hypothetical protein
MPVSSAARLTVCTAHILRKTLDRHWTSFGGMSKMSVTRLNDPLPLPLILADHRAGSQSLFVYPWC